MEIGSIIGTAGAIVGGIAGTWGAIFLADRYRRMGKYKLFSLMLVLALIFFGNAFAFWLKLVLSQ